MNIHEYQAREILESYGVTVPRAGVASTPDEARQLAVDLGGRVVIKAQVHAGGRGKAGGVKLVNSPDEAAEAAAGDRREAAVLARRRRHARLDGCS